MSPFKITTQLLPIFLIFFKLGCISFGGPAAHLVFFHQNFVKKLNWLSEAEYVQLVALTQILPGPSSSQVGIAIGFIKQGYWGSIIAWIGFTLPSFLFMTVSAILSQHYFNQLPLQFFHVIQLMVLAVVIWAFWQMLQNFCKEIWQYLLMLASAFFIYSSSLAFSQILLILVAALIGIIFSKKLKNNKQLKSKLSTSNESSKNQSADSTNKIVLSQRPKHKSYLWLILFMLPFIGLPIVQHYFSTANIQSIEGLYYSASTVFGGGHIILPLLHQDFVSTGLISNQQFDLGYAIAQLMPGPLFSFASYIGALLHFTDSMWINAIIATIIIFLPSFFLIWGALPYWAWLMRQKNIIYAIAGINAAVIGLLLCLIVQMGEKYVQSWVDLIFLIFIILLLRTRLPIVITLLSSGIGYFLLLLLVS